MTCRNYLRPDPGSFGYTTATGNGATSTFTIGWDFPFKDDVTVGSTSPYIKVYVDDDEASWVFASTNSITITPTPGNGLLVEIIRESSLADNLSVFNNSSDLTATNLQTDSDQKLWLIQELWGHLKGLGCQVDSLSTDGGAANEYVFTGDGSTTVFSLSPETNLSDVQVLVFVNGVRQGTDTYTVSELAGVSKVTFSEAPFNGAKLTFVVFAGTLTAYNVADGSITAIKIADDAVTFGKINFDATGTDGQALMKRAGTATFSTITTSDVSGFDTQVRTNRLDQMAIPTANLNINSRKLTSVATGTAGTDAVNKTQMDAAIAAAVAAISSTTPVSGTCVIPSGNATWVEVDVGFQWTSLWFIFDVGNGNVGYALDTQLGGGGSDAGGALGSLFNPGGVHARLWSAGSSEQRYEAKRDDVNDLWNVVFQRITNGFKWRGYVSGYGGTVTVRYIAFP